MKLSHRRILSLGLLLVAVGGGWRMASDSSQAATKPQPEGQGTTATEPKKTPLQLFMRKKLEATQKVMEGLVVEDYEMIAQGAKQLKAISAAADFVVVKEAMYTQHADEFRRVVDRLEKQAKEKRLDGAALANMDLTLSCIDCHRFVRSTLITNN
jgi:hypothetical protein